MSDLATHVFACAVIVVVLLIVIGIPLLEAHLPEEYRDTADAAQAVIPVPTPVVEQAASQAADPLIDPVPEPATESYELPLKLAA